VVEEFLFGGRTELCCCSDGDSRIKNLRVVYTPASGIFKGLECTLKSSFIADFLQQPRHPRSDEFHPFPPKTEFTDRAIASSRLPLENSRVDVNGKRLATDAPTTPPKHTWLAGQRRSRCMCGMGCLAAAAALRGAPAPDADAKALLRTASEQAGLGGPWPAAAE
jgi:hypothetical protein